MIESELLPMITQLKYFIKSKLRDATSYSTILSVAGAFLIATPYRLPGFIIWIVSNSIWIYYFRKTSQTNPMILFTIYLTTSILGVVNNI